LKELHVALQRALFSLLDKREFVDRLRQHRLPLLRVYGNVSRFLPQREKDSKLQTVRASW
jgi:hypothetical protein